MTLGNRIKMIRKELGLTQVDFGQKIGISGASVSTAESGKTRPDSQTMQLICMKCNVRRQWLEEGVGPMRMEVTEDDEIVDEVLAGEDEFIKAVIRGIAKTPGGWDKMKEVFTAIQAELNKQKPEP